MDVKTKLPPEVLAFFKKQGSIGGKIGGKRSLETMTPEARTARAKKAAAKSAEVRKKLAAKRRAKL
jgi:hypothetical protein